MCIRDSDSADGAAEIRIDGGVVEGLVGLRRRAVVVNGLVAVSYTHLTLPTSDLV